MKFNEGDIIEGCKRYSIKSQKALYELYAPVLYPICRRYICDKNLAADYLQDTFLIIYSQINTYNFQGSFEGWLKRICMNVCLQALRKKKFFEDVDNHDVQHEQDEFSNEYDDLLEMFTYDDILNIIEELKPPLNIIFKLFYVDNWTHREIATELAITEANCRVLLFRSKAKMKEILLKKLERIG